MVVAILVVSLWWNIKTEQPFLLSVETYKLKIFLLKTVQENGVVSQIQQVLLLFQIVMVGANFLTFCLT